MGTVTQGSTAWKVLLQPHRVLMPRELVVVMETTSSEVCIS